MIRILVTICLLVTRTISGFCQSDTISYWHVSLDKKVIAEFSVVTENPSVEIITSDLSKNSILTVEYFRDTQCHDCRPCLTICNTEDEVLFKIKRSETLNKQNLKLTRLIKLYTKGKYSSFRIYRKEPPFQDQYLFTLTFIKQNYTQQMVYVMAVICINPNFVPII
jgi:hypothetical protein